MAMIEVHDEGEGIPVEMRNKLFARFSSITRANTGHKIASSGIGLHLSKKLVEFMQGAIGYREGKNGRGSVFWFTLPLAKAPNPVSVGRRDI
jgi:signal transduction histidine kinase